MFIQISTYIIVFLLSAASLQVRGSDIVSPEDNRQLSGRITDGRSGESLPGAAILVKGLGTGVSSDIDGHFVLLLPSGEHWLEVSYLGYLTKEVRVSRDYDGKLSINLEPTERYLKEVVISDRRPGDQVDRTEMGVARIDAKAIAQIPAMLGEVDVIRAIQLLPGVQSVGEGSSGFNVRGGSMDQNLILMDEATVYNASHLMGFFSVFNNDVVKDVNLYKGNIPAMYGGRLSSLLNVRMREGDMQNFGGSGGIGSISSRLMLEGPLVKDKVSLIAAGRRSYADIFIPLSPNTDIHDNKLYFYDMNVKLNAHINENNRLQFSSYHGKDVFRFGERDPFTMDWGNTTYTLGWRHVLNDDWLLNANLLYTGYAYSLAQEGGDGSGFIWEAGNRDMGMKLDMAWIPNDKYTLRFGLSSVYHMFNPGLFKGLGDGGFLGEIGSVGSNALSHALFISNDHNVTEQFSMEYGLRYAVFQSMGKATVYSFDDAFNTIGSKEYGPGEVYNTWAGFEPRLGVRYALNASSAFKASYNRALQFVHLASYSDGGNPLDIWMPSSGNIKPQIANQFALGYFLNLAVDEQILESSVEVFYKAMQNQIDFKDNAWLMLNPEIEGEFRFGQATSYGAEFLLRKNEGRLNGWISYTWSRALRQFDAINGGNVYPASYDRPHNFNIVTNYQLSRRIVLSATWVYTTGAPVTLPAGRFEYGNQIRPVYTDRNGFRLPSYHRLDLGATIKGRTNRKNGFRGEWNISVYNAYYRKNTWMLDFRQDEEQTGKVDAYKVYLFPILPSVTYNFFF